MKRHFHRGNLTAILVAAAVLLPPRLEADPVASCSAADMAALTEAERTETAESYRDTVASKFQSERERTQARIADLSKQKLCDKDWFGLGYAKVVCGAQYAQLDNIDRVINKRVDDCGEILDHLSAATRSQAFTQSPKCLKDLYQDIYTGGRDGTAGEAKDIVEIFKSTTSL